MVTMPPLPQSPLRLAAAAVHLVAFFFRRADRSGDIYPDDEPRGRIAGAAPERVVVMGERGEISLGVVTHELSIAGFLAREHHRSTGRGSEWSIATLPRDRISDGPALASHQATELARTDLVVLLAGISDCLALTSAARWEHHLRATLSELFRELPLDSHVAVAEIPPLDNAGSLSRVARLAAGHRSTALNRRTRTVLMDHPCAIAIPFPPELTDRLWVPQSEEERYTRTYALWSRSLMSAIGDAWHAPEPADGSPAHRRTDASSPLPRGGSTSDAAR
jgi:hypothetical protein